VVPSPERIRLVVLFGGRSAEHEVSCVSALHVLRAADPDRYDLVPIGITRDGAWVAADDAVAALRRGAAALPSPDEGDRVALDILHALAPRGVGAPVVAVPLLHGPMGEDGTVQGLLELAGVPYVGAGVLASALCMDKAATKAQLAHHGLPLARWLAARDTELDDAFTKAVGEELGWPVFVKPANLGSSIGISKAADASALGRALAEALRYDEYVVVEEAIVGREIEVAVLGNARARASVPGEVVPSREFYDFDDKYTAGTAGLRVPARLPEAVAAEVQRLAMATVLALRVDGMARVDFFYEDPGRGFLVNEVNTIPGFTPISMYPALWQASGLSYPELLDELVALALARHRRRSRFRTDRGG